MSTREGEATMALKKKARASEGSKSAKKDAAKVAPKLTRYSKGEHIKVVPLHSPKPPMPIDELSKARQEQSDADLFDGQTSAAPKAHLAYFGGSLLTNVQVVNIFWGKKWSAGPGAGIATKLNNFYKAILVSPLIDQLAEYSVPGKSIGHGSLIGSKVITANAPVGSVTDTTVRTQLHAWISAHTVPANTPNTLYVIYLDPGIVSIMGGSKSCSSYCGYHDAVGQVYYGVMPYPNCAGCLGGLAAFDALTGTSSHELCEAITDPVPGAGWYDNHNGEIGDICAWSFKKVAGYTVQLEWSNLQNQCV
jgi:hypothetical protein